MMNYRNIHIFIAAKPESPDAYRVYVKTPKGEAEGEFEWSVPVDEINDIVAEIGTQRRVQRRKDAPRVAKARQLGQQLYAALFDEETVVPFSHAIRETREGQCGMRICLHLQNVPELAALPWEYLYRPNDDNFFSLYRATPMIRALDMAEAVPPLQTVRPLRILGVVSNPTNLGQLNVDSEQEHLENALAILRQKGAVEIHWLETATLDELQTALRRGEYHILHFIGHGYYDTDLDEGGLALENAQGREHLVRASILGTMLRDHATLRLAVLNACEGAYIGGDDTFAGVAPALLRAGLPAAIAMQFAISDRTAVQLASKLYGVLADGDPVDTALSETRRSIFGHDEHEVEWGTPVLYSRVNNGVIFELPSDEAPADNVSKLSLGESVAKPLPVTPRLGEAINAVDVDAAIPSATTVVNTQTRPRKDAVSNHEKKPGVLRRTFIPGCLGVLLIFGLCIIFFAMLPVDETPVSADTLVTPTEFSVTTTAPTTTPSLSPAAYFPTEESMTWHYTGTVDGQLATVTTSVKPESSEDGRSMETFYTDLVTEDKTHQSYTDYFWENETLYLDWEVDLFGNDLLYDPPLPLLSLPVKETQWTWQGTVDMQINESFLLIPGKVTIAATFETLETTFGQLDTIHLRYVLELDEGAQPFQRKVQDLWLAADYGIVQQSATVTTDEEATAYDLKLAEVAGLLQIGAAFPLLASKE